MGWKSTLPAIATLLGLWFAYQNIGLHGTGFLAAFDSSTPSWSGIENELRKFEDFEHEEKTPGGFLRFFVNATINILEKHFKNKPGVNETDPYPYWKFLPTPVMQITGGEQGSFTPIGTQGCFKIDFQAEYHSVWKPLKKIPLVHDYMRLKIQATQKDANTACTVVEDIYMLSTLGKFTFVHVKEAGSMTVDVPIQNTVEKEWDAKERGLRMFQIRGGSTDAALWSLLETVRLFEPLIGGPSVALSGAEKNLDFLKKYASLDIKPRQFELDIDLDPDTIQDGDFMGLMRLDGLDPMLQWAMGSSTGHTAMALRFDGKLHIVESTSKGNYWPTNGIQKTEWNMWLKQYRAADYNVVHLPLSAESAKKFNADAARKAFIEDYEGYDYGYANMLWSWTDVVGLTDYEGNFPCIPPESGFKGCLSFSAFEVLVATLEELVPSIAGKMFLPGLRRRVDLPKTATWGATLHAAHTKFDGKVYELINVPERDEWKYDTTRVVNGTVVNMEGPQRMCDALVCSMWKAGGLFEPYTKDVHCSEFTNWDAWGLKLFDTDIKNKRPQACKDADPDNDLCQIMGKYQLNLRTPMYAYNTRDVFPHIAEKCPSMAPGYDRPAQC